MNEGLATFAENNCNGYSVAQIYRYLGASKRLIPLDSLSRDFYGQPEMIAYHQAAFVVEFLLRHYGIAKCQDAWVRGYSAFQEVYGLSIDQLLLDLDRDCVSRSAVVPAIDWAVFQQGCN